MFLVAADPGRVVASIQARREAGDRREICWHQRGEYTFIAWYAGPGDAEPQELELPGKQAAATEGHDEQGRARRRQRRTGIPEEKFS